MKPFYVFLDIDGVMNDFTYWNECKAKHGNGKVMSYQNYPFNPNSLNNLMLLNKQLTNKGYVMRIVLSSTWRVGITDVAIVNSRLAEYGMTIFDKTPQLNSVAFNQINDYRSLEIKEWLENNNNPMNYLILDDNERIANKFEEKHYVITNANYGFNDEKLKEAIDKI